MMTSVTSCGLLIMMTWEPSVPRVLPLKRTLGVGVPFVPNWLHRGLFGLLPGSWALLTSVSACTLRST